MTETQLAAYRATQEFLDESRNVSGRDHMQVVLDALRKARGIIMQCAIALEPPEDKAPDIKPLTFDPLLKMERHVIFEGLTPSSEMTTAVFTAQKMGCTNFEIVVKTDEGKRRNSRYEDDDQYVNPFMGMLRRHVGETHAVTIYAVTIK